MPLLDASQLNPGQDKIIPSIMAGLQMRQSLQKAADDHQEFQQRTAQNAQNMQWQNITNQMALEGNSRAVNNGMVADDSTPAPVAQQQQAPAPAPAQNSTPTNYSPVPQPAAPVAQAAPIAQPSQPIMRKADSSRTVTYTDAQGNKQQRELLTPQEQVQRQAAAKNAMEKATGIRVSVEDPHNPGQMVDAYIQPNELAEWQRVNNANQPITLGPNGELPRTVPASMVPSTVRYVNNQNTNNTRAGIADANNDTRNTIAIGNNATSEDNAGTRATATTTAATTRANGAVAAAGVRADRPATAGQTGVQNRFNQRELDAIAKQENGDGTPGHPGIHATRTQLGQQLADGQDADGKPLKDGKGKLNGAGVMMQNRLNGLTQSVQDLQLKKAKIYNFQQPSAAIIGGVKDGGTAEMPDGHVWTKHDGVLYVTK